MNSAPRFVAPQEALEIAARAVRPLLNRVVFTGRHAAAYLATDATTLTATTFATDAMVQVLTSMSLDRMAPELQRLGLTRGLRTATGDLWRVDERLALDVRFVGAENTNVWLEYATLLTVPVILDDETTARLTSAPALVALNWAAQDSERVHLVESPHLEEIIQLTATRATIEEEIAASPPELRRFVAHATTRFLAADCASHVIRSALPDAARLPAMVHRITERLTRLSALA